MCCCSRRTFGLTMGGLSLVSQFLSVILLSVVCLNSDKIRNFDQFIPAIITITVVLLVLMSISIIFILGILKNRHRYMLPYLILGAIGFVIHAISGFITIILGLVRGGHFGETLLILLIYGLVFALNYYILRLLYELYKDIRDANKEYSTRGQRLRNVKQHQAKV